MITPEKERVLDLFQKGREYYKAQEFKQAYQCFHEALEIDENDGPSKLYRARCKHYMANPPGPDWDGVFTATSK